MEQAIELKIGDRVIVQGDTVTITGTSQIHRDMFMGMNETTDETIFFLLKHVDGIASLFAH